MNIDRSTLGWIKRELGPIIRQAIEDSQTIEFDEALLAAMAYRETVGIISRYKDTHHLKELATLTRGDYSRRSGEAEPQYHGFSFWQIDIDSFPDFIKSGDWKDPYKACRKAIAVLDGKMRYIRGRVSLDKDRLYRASIAAYNCGEGNVVKVLKARQDVDSRTAHGDYSKSVLEIKALYKLLP